MDLEEDGKRIFSNQELRCSTVGMHFMEAHNHDSDCALIYIQRNTKKVA